MDRELSGPGQQPGSSRADRGGSVGSRTAYGDRPHLQPRLHQALLSPPPADGRSSCLGFASRAQPKGIPEPRRALSLSPEELRQFLEPPPKGTDKTDEIGLWQFVTPAQAVSDFEVRGANALLPSLSLGEPQMTEHRARLLGKRDPP